MSRYPKVPELRGMRPLKTVDVTVMMTGAQINILENLLDTGLFGTTVGEAAERLVSQKLQDMEREKATNGHI